MEVEDDSNNYSNLGINPEKSDKQAMITMMKQYSIEEDETVPYRNQSSPNHLDIEST